MPPETQNRQHPPVPITRFQGALQALNNIQPAQTAAVRFGMRDKDGTPFIAIAPGYEDQYKKALENERSHLAPYATYLPSIIETTESGKWVMIDLPSRLFENNYVFVSGPVTSAMADAIKMQFTFLANKMMDDKGKVDPGKVEPVKMIINSPGGEILAMDQILDAMNEIKNSGIPIQTYVGYAASAATLIASNGTFGQRFISPKARFMIHQPLGGFQGQATDIEIQYKLVNQMKQELIEHLYERTKDKATGEHKRTKEEIAKDVERDYWMRGQEVVDYGLADAVVNHYPSGAASEETQ